MATTLEELNEWLNIPHEDKWIEFKEAKNQYDTDKVMEYCVGIANESGGKLILGVTNEVPRRISGTQAFNNIQDIQSKIFERLEFRVDVEEMFHREGRIVIFHIPSRPKGLAYSYNGVHFMRIGDELHIMSQDRLREIFNDGKPDWFGEIALKNLNETNIYEFLDVDSYFLLTKQPKPSGDNILNRFEQERLIVKEGKEFSITNLGAILFAKDLDAFEDLKRKSLRVIVYEGENKTANTKIDQIGRKGYAVGFQGLIDFINSYLPKNEEIKKVFREIVPMYPTVAIRELVANALIHQDFNETGTSVLIEIYTDRIEISNPGLPFIPPERFIDEFKSRNERLATLMRRLRICEERGSGIDRVIWNVEMFQLPAPDFRVGELRTMAILFSHKKFEEMDNDDKIRACYQHCCLKWVMQERMTNQSLRDRFKLPVGETDTISRLIHDAVETKHIKLANPENASKRYAQYVPIWA